MKEWLFKNGITLQKVLWKTEKFAIFVDTKGKVWRYMPEYKMAWPWEEK